MLSLQEGLSARQELLGIARGAAAIVLEGYRKPMVPEFKGPVDLVTRYDLASEAYIRTEMARRLPWCDLVAEESGGAITAGRPVVYADPLDGTTNFSHGHPFFAVSLALASDGAFLAGVVIAPALGWEYLAARGAGVTRNGALCHVSEVTALDRALLATGFPYDRRTSPDDNLGTFVDLEKHHAQGIRRCGSAALDLCMVADGTYDGYWEHKLQPWDLAAGAVLVVEAGGRVTSFAGGSADVLAGELVASNGGIHGELLRAIAAAEGRCLDLSKS